MKTFFLNPLSRPKPRRTLTRPRNHLGVASLGPAGELGANRTHSNRILVARVGIQGVEKIFIAVIILVISILNNSIVRFLVNSSVF